MSTWEERMAAQSLAKGRDYRTQFEREYQDYPDEHEGHHRHVQGNGILCSCGESFGCFSFVPDPRCWSDDPAERAQYEREEADWRAWIHCWICGAPGVTAEDVSWPPRTISRLKTAPREKVRRGAAAAT